MSDMRTYLLGKLTVAYLVNLFQFVRENLGISCVVLVMILIWLDNPAALLPRKSSHFEHETGWPEVRFAVSREEENILLVSRTQFILLCRPAYILLFINK